MKIIFFESLTSALFIFCILALAGIGFILWGMAGFVIVILLVYFIMAR